MHRYVRNLTRITAFCWIIHYDVNFWSLYADLNCAFNSKLNEYVSLLSKNNICLYEDVLLLTDVRWPSSNPVILNTGSRWTEGVRDPNTVARDLLSRMVKLLKGILYLIGQEKE